ncbi:MAG: hypothetical protein JWQ20_2328, partial [Conexibacter sp.]|nr:hypothetical protein [Conexibacter sp.]
WHQGESLLHDQQPSLFVHYDDGLFYPHFAFYGGTLYSVAGALSAVLGGEGLPAYVTTWVAAFAVAYGGWVWLARMAGLGRWAMHAPAVLFITSPYYLTLVYVRGDWPEFVAVSSMPMLAAAGLSVLRAERLRLLPAVALAGATVMFSGSHNLTLLWGGVVVLVLAAVLWLAVPAARRQVTRRSVLRVLGIVVPALLVNAWFLVPDVTYQAHTIIASMEVRGWLRDTSPFVAPEHLFALGRSTAVPSRPGFDLGLPVLAMGWALIAVALVLRRTWGTTWMRTFLALAGVTIALIVLMTHVGLVLALPKVFTMIQFSYRLESYILLTIAGGVLAALVLLRGAPVGVRRWTWAMVPVLAISLTGAARQVGDHPEGELLGSFGLPAISSMGIFADRSVKEIPPGPLVKVTFPPALVRDDRLTVTVPLNPGQLVDTNLMVMPALMHVDGARMAGAHTVVDAAGNIRRHTVLQVDRTAKPGAATITLRAAHPPAVTVGRLLSLLGILGLLAHAAVPAVRAGWRRAGAIAHS